MKFEKSFVKKFDIFTMKLLEIVNNKIEGGEKECPYNRKELSGIIDYLRY